MWDGKQRQQLMWQSLVEYARIVHDTTHKEGDKVTIYDDGIGKYDYYGTNFFTIEIILEPCIGTYEHLMLA